MYIILYMLQNWTQWSVLYCDIVWSMSLCHYRAGQLGRVIIIAVESCQKLSKAVAASKMRSCCWSQKRSIIKTRLDDRNYSSSCFFMVCLNEFCSYFRNGEDIHICFRVNSFVFFCFNLYRNLFVNPICGRVENIR